MEKDPQHSQAPTTKGVPVVEDTRAVAAALVVVEDTADRAALVVHGAMAAHTMEDLTMDLMVITKDHIMDAVTDPLMALLEGPVVLVVGAVGAHGDAEDSLEAVVAAAASTHPPLRLISGISSTRAFLPTPTITRPLPTAKTILLTQMFSILSPHSLFTSLCLVRRRKMLVSIGTQRRASCPSLVSSTAPVTRNS
jgi:hypothetical protein